MSTSIDGQVSRGASDFRPGCFPRIGFVREPEMNGTWWSERHLQCLWLDSRLRPQLHTTGGARIEVLDPGVWNGTAGPDFRDAVIRIAGEPRKGDVEIHIHPADWYLHGHDTDSNYDRVILHVTWFAPNAGEVHPEIPLAVLQDAVLSEKPNFSFDQIETELYPWNAHPDTDRPCRGVLGRLSPDVAGAWLESAGRARITRKANELAARMERAGSREQSFYAEIMGALGLRWNATPIRALADAVPLEELVRHADPLERYALLLGSAGLLPREASPTLPEEYLVGLWNASYRAGAMDVPEAARAWRLVGVRPSNHPRVRLAVAAVLFGTATGLLDSLLALSQEDAKAWCRAADKLFRAKAEEAAVLLSPSRKAGVGLLGKGRVHAILINAVIPFFALENESAWTLATGVPGEDIGASMKEMAYRLFGGDHNSAIYSKSALRMQGLLEVWKGFCGASAQSCRSCGLVKHHLGMAHDE